MRMVAELEIDDDFYNEIKTSFPGTTDAGILYTNIRHPRIHVIHTQVGTIQNLIETANAMQGITHPYDE